MANSYDKGDLVRVTATFTNSAGTPVDPAALTFKFKNPLGTVTPYTYPTNPELVRGSTGVYYVDINANVHGTWRTRFEATGVGQSAVENFFMIKDSDFD